MDDGTRWITSLCNFYAKVWQMTPAKGTREWLKPALVKGRDKRPGAQVFLSSPHFHLQSLTLPWVFQNFFHLITSFSLSSTAPHTRTCLWDHFIQSSLCGWTQNKRLHSLIHSMHQNVHQLAVKAGIFGMCLAMTIFPKSLQRTFPVEEDHVELLLKTDSQTSREIYWIRISLGDGALWGDPVSLTNQKAQRDSCAFLYHFPCRELWLEVEKVASHALIFKLCPLLGWNLPSNSDSNGDPWNGQNPSKAKSQAPRFSDMWMAPRNRNEPDQSHCSQRELCLQRGHDVVRNVRRHWRWQGNELRSGMVILNVVLISPALRRGVGKCHPTCW